MDDPTKAELVEALQRIDEDLLALDWAEYLAAKVSREIRDLIDDLEWLDDAGAMDLVRTMVPANRPVFDSNFGSVVAVTIGSIMFEVNVGRRRRLT